MPKKILVIDDEEAVRKAFEYALRDTDYEVDLAPGGREGVKLALENDYDLIYLDLRMPEMNGIAVLREIRKVEPDQKIYIVTAFHREYFKDLVGVRNDGIDFELLSKPLERDQIITITRAILNGIQPEEGGE